MVENNTQTQFVLLGITDSPCVQVGLFGLFLLIYIVTLTGNIWMMVLVSMVPSLHTPMYFFLTHLSFVDVCYSTVVSPKLLADLLAENKTISFAGCVVQFHGFAFFATTECHLLAAMSYDRHVAICHPLLYTTLISSRVCWQLVASSYLFSLLSAIVYTSCMFGSYSCGPNQIDHFFCDISSVLKLMCSDTHGREMIIFALVAINGVSTSTFILLSYLSVLRAVLRMRSAQSKSKAFNTSISHLTAVSLFYGTIFFMYLQPVSSHGNRDKMVSIFYTMVTPMLNPFIYSLRNKEVKDALVKSGIRMLNHRQ